MKAAQARLVREEEGRIGQAWMTAFLGRVEKMPSLDKLLGRKTESLNHEQVMGTMRAITGHMPKRTWKEWLDQR